VLSRASFGNLGGAIFAGLPLRLFFIDHTASRSGLRKKYHIPPTMTPPYILRAICQLRLRLLPYPTPLLASR
jgi:hypothetical protein